MSIVEQALKKLQSRGDRRLSSGPAAGTVVTVQRPGGVAATERQRKAPIGNPSKLVRIDYERLRADGLLPPEHQQRELAHQYRTLKRPLIRKAFETSGLPSRPGAISPRSIMISSALPGEGKTFTSINLALSLSLEKDHSVLLVDADVAKPHISQIFGAQSEPGLLDLLGEASPSVESVVLPTDVRGLSILPVGRRSETATELLASSRMRQIIGQLEQLDPQGLVVVDSPPILLTSEARVLASLFAQVVLVVRVGTAQQAVMDAIGVIGDGPGIGLVLNQAAHEGTAGSYYGYYSGADAVDAAADTSEAPRATSATGNP